MFESMKLNNVAEIRLGLPFKKAINDAGDQGTCYLIQTKDISPDEAIDFQNLPKVIPETSPVQHFLSKDDILLRLRGPIFSAAIIDKNIDFPIITNNQVAVIRCNEQKIDPYYLHWFLNSPEGQNILNQFSEGSNISKINLKNVSSLEWKIPPIEQQLNISNIQKNWSTQRNIYKRLIEVNDLFFNELCKKINYGELNDYSK